MDLTHPQYPPPLSKINISQAKPEPRDLTQAQPGVQTDNPLSLRVIWGPAPIVKYSQIFYLR